MEQAVYKDIEYSIVNVSELGSELRLDSEYYDPPYLRNEQLITNKKWSYLGKELTTCQYGLSVAMNEEQDGYMILKMDNIIGILADDVNVKFAPISKETFNNYKLNKKDILFNRVNSDEFVGRTGIYLLDGEHTFASYLIRLRAKNDYSNSYISVFLNTSYGRQLLKRVSRRAVNQANINAEEIKSLKIPMPADSFQKYIEKIILKANALKMNAYKLLRDAEDSILSEVGLKDWEPQMQRINISGIDCIEEDNKSVKNLSLCLKANRFDAEYWETKYDEIIGKITNYKEGWDEIRNCFKQNKQNFNIKKDDYYKYVEIGDVNIHNGDINPSLIRGDKLPSNAKIKLFEGNIIISKVRTYRGAVTIIRECNLIGSGAFTVLNEQTKINKETLFVLLKTIPYLQLTLKYNTGTSYPTLSDDDILNLPIPLVAKEVQDLVARKVEEVFKSISDSKKLIKIAQKSVEIYIEKDEDASIAYLTGKMITMNLLL